jgi:hypothetical protein
MSDDLFGSEETALAERPEGQMALSGTSGGLMEMAKFLAESTMVPAIYQTKPANCFIAVELAQRLGVSPMLVMQSMVPINGKPSWSSQFLTSITNNCGRFTPIRYEWFSEEGKGDWGCRAYMTEIATGEKLLGTKITMVMVKAEGWLDKKGSKWATMPNQMMMYRAAAFLVRAYAPELLQGMHTREEQEDMTINVTPAREKSVAETAWEARDANI